MLDLTPQIQSTLSVFGPGLCKKGVHIPVVCRKSQEPQGTFLRACETCPDLFLSSPNIFEAPGCPRMGSPCIVLIMASVVSGGTTICR